MELLSEFKKDSNNRVRANTALVLIRHGKEEGFEILNNMLCEKDEWMIASAVYALGEIGSPHCLDIIIEKGIDKRTDWSIRRNYIISLAKFSNNNIEKADKLIKNVLNSSNEEDLIYMVRVIGEYSLKELY